MGGGGSLRTLADQSRWLGEGAREYSIVLLEIVISRVESLSLTRIDIRYMEDVSHVVLVGEVSD